MPILSTSSLLTIPAICLTTDTVPEQTSGIVKHIKRDLLWSHSEVFVTSYGTLGTLVGNVPPLTTVYTPTSSCMDRWVLRSSESCGDGSTIRAIVWSINPTRSIVSDASYIECQPYGMASYSPGICPSGQTIAEVTAFTSSHSSGTRTFWQASCCRSGMTFGTEFADLCLSHFATPFPAHAAIMTTPTSGEIVTPVYEYTISYKLSGIVIETSVTSSITTLALGLAMADPVVVAWQIEDVRLFPTEYVSSLVARYNVPAPASTSTPTTSVLEPTVTPKSGGLSTGTKVGTGVGVALAAALIGGLLVFWCLRRRRNASATEEPDVVVPEMEDQDNTHTERKWYFGGRWRSEVDTQTTQNELDSKAVRVVPGPPAELEAHEPAVEGAKIAGNHDGRV